MTPKKAVYAALLIAATVILYLVGRNMGPKPTPAPSPPPPNATAPVAPEQTQQAVTPPVGDPGTPAPPNSKPTSSTPALTAPPNVVMMPVAETAQHLHDPASEPQEDLHIIEGILEFYRRAFKENPVAGLNEEVVDALVGNNDKRAGFIPVDHPAINDQGQLVDRWGTPYVFHALSGTHLQILSAGPDQKVGTSDDLFIE